MRLLVDSSFVIDFLRGQPEARERWVSSFDQGDEPIVTEVVVCEVRAGLRELDEGRLVAFLEPVEFVQPGPATAMLAGRWRSEAHGRGFRLSLADALIAAAAHDGGAAVLTRNIRDFALTPVRIETY
ncbi:MAG: PIN domain-containing protein [Chloroflexota bacterium]|nr:MAG: PIN domain-containing protein [Chloroflexota bacterium]